jgi:hypothetical protein
MPRLRLDQLQEAAHSAYQLSQEMAFQTKGIYQIDGEHVDLRTVFGLASQATRKLSLGSLQSLTATDKAALGVMAYAVRIVERFPDEDISRDYRARRLAPSRHAYADGDDLMTSFSASNSRSFLALETELDSNWYIEGSLSHNLRTLGI